MEQSNIGNKMKDNRYSYHREYTGKETKPIVVRFCGEFIGSCDDFKEADKIAINHHKQLWGS